MTRVGSAEHTSGADSKMGKNVFGEMCAITGAPAKYRDPVSGLPYADLAAFKVIKERYHTAKPEAVEVSPGAPTCSPSRT